MLQNRPAFNHTRGDSALTPCELCIHALERIAVERGTDNQRERFAAGLLPELELAALARAELFAPFKDIPRWNVTNGRGAGALGPRDITHTADCYGRGEDAIRYQTTTPKDVPGTTWTTLKKLTVLASQASQHDWLNAGQGFELKLCAHHATCRICGGEAVRYTARVMVSWAGRTLSREYQL